MVEKRRLRALEPGGVGQRCGTIEIWPAGRRLAVKVARIVIDSGKTALFERRTDWKNHGFVLLDMLEIELLVFEFELHGCDQRR